MSADMLRRAAAELREEWSDGHNPRGTAWHRERDFHLAVADWLDSFAARWGTPADMPFGEFKRALAVARAYLGESS